MSKPEKVIKAGAVRASIFRNIVKSAEGQTTKLPKVVLEVRYRDKSGQWRGTHTMNLNDLPKAILTLQQAFAYLLEHREEPTKT